MPFMTQHLLNDISFINFYGKVDVANKTILVIRLGSIPPKKSFTFSKPQPNKTLTWKICPLQVKDKSYEGRRITTKRFEMQTSVVVRKL